MPLGIPHAEYFPHAQAIPSVGTASMQVPAVDDFQGLFYDAYEVDEESIRQYDDLVREFPHLAVNLMDTAASLGLAPALDENLHYTSDFTSKQSPLHGHQMVQLLPGHDDIHDHLPAHHLSDTAFNQYSKSHHCLLCGKKYDRYTRARDCGYKHLDLKPYRCNGGCGKSQW